MIGRQLTETLLPDASATAILYFGEMKAISCKLAIARDEHTCYKIKKRVKVGCT
jgi:hypothetical protein